MLRDENEKGMNRRTFMSSTAAIGAGLLFVPKSFAIGETKSNELRYREDGIF